MSSSGFDLLKDHPTFEHVKSISKGAYSIVILARHKHTGELLALKFIEPEQKISNAVEREIMNHKKLYHPHVVLLHDVCRIGSYLVLVLGFAAGGSLRKLIRSRGRLEEAEARRFFQQLILAVHYCHKMGVSSRDIKPENTLLDGETPPNVLLADFGYSKAEDAHSMAQTRLGTPAYAAPEIFLAGPGKSYDANSVDIWSCGVMLYEMLTGFHPFRRADDSQKKESQQSELIWKRVQAGDFSFPDNIPLPQDCKDLVRGMLATNPAERLSVKQIFKNTWFKIELPKGALQINTMLVSESRQQMPSDEEMIALRKIIRPDVDVNLKPLRINPGPAPFDSGM